ncbi:MAG TPA: hypothetical protein VKB58_04945 [Terriglobales bacterium]|jgi:hypothetical protein|nr:hypothetical protein [Terriglobales bacterium]
MKKLLICGMLLGLLTSVSYAQRGRSVGGIGTSGARVPNVGPISPHAGVNPDSIGMPHGGVLPNARTTSGKTSKTTTPNATSDPKAQTVGPHANTTSPTRGTLPNARIGPGADQ